MTSSPSVNRLVAVEGPNGRWYIVREGDCKRVRLAPHVDYPSYSAVRRAILRMEQR
jgi:hypothetical protein